MWVLRIKFNSSCLWCKDVMGPQESELPNQSDVLSYIPCDGYSGLANSTHNLFSSCLKDRNSSNDLYWWGSLWFICYDIQSHKKKKAEWERGAFQWSFQYFGDFFFLQQCLRVCLELPRSWGQSEDQESCLSLSSRWLEHICAGKTVIATEGETWSECRVWDPYWS